MDIGQWEFAYVPTTGVRRAHETPIVLATEASLEGFGRLVDDPKIFPIEIVRWPAQGWRPIDPNSGDQGGITEGLFEFCWKGETLYARNNAVGDSYLFGWSNWPEEAATGACDRARPDLARELSSGRRSALLSPQRAEFRHSAGAAGRRCNSGKVRDFLVRRRPRPVSASQRVARGGGRAGR